MSKNPSTTPETDKEEKRHHDCSDTIGFGYMKLLAFACSLELRLREAEKEKERRIYYQDICYAVANQLEKANRETNGRHLIVVGTSASPATGLQNALQVLLDERDQLRAELERVKADTKRLDYLQSTTKGYGNGWKLRESTNGRGMRLHETSWEGATPTVRLAIDAAMREDGK